MDNSDQSDHLIKVVLTGDAATGKSSILLRFTEGAFDPELACTIGVDFKLHLVDFHDRTKIKLSIWDTAGQEKFQSLTPSYYRDAHVVFIVYDVGNKKSFDNAPKWLSECDLYANHEDVLKILVGNKIDLPSHEVTPAEGKQFADKHHLLFAECSSKDDIGIDNLFELVINGVLNHPTLSKETHVGGNEGREKGKGKGVALEASVDQPATGYNDCYC